MRHRLSHSEQDNSLQHDQRRVNRNNVASNQRKQQRLREQRDWIFLVRFGTCFFVVCILVFAIVHSVKHRGHGRYLPLIRNGQENKYNNTDVALSNHKANAKSTDTDNRAANQKCAFFGCTIIAPEASQLDYSNATYVISPKHILLTHKSNRKLPAPVNQDRAILISPFVTEEIETSHLETMTQSSDNFLMGIFDGHDNAGGDVAQFSMDEIPLRIARKLSKPASPSDHDVVKKAIIQAHEEANEALPPETSIMGGCTANIVLRLGKTLYMSNVGDSYSYLVTYTTPTKMFHDYKKVDDLQPHLQGNITIHHKNIRHKPHLPDENSRILSLGGRIHVPPPPKNPMGSRVIVKSTVHNEDVGLAMSRSIGDLEWTKVGVIPTPDVDVIDLNEMLERLSDTSKLFVVVASDGLFDNRKMEFVTKHLAHILYESGSSSHTMLEGTKKLIDAASPLNSEWYRDDISFVVRMLEL